MFRIYRSSHWRVFAINKQERSRIFCEYVREFEKLGNILYRTISYTQNASYVIAHEADEIYGMDAFEKKRYLQKCGKELAKFSEHNLCVKHVSMQEAAYKSIRFYDLRIQHKNGAVKLDKEGDFTLIESNKDILTLFHAPNFQCSYEFVDLV